MKVDIDHVLFWMDAIRNSKNTDRTLESFWKGQIKSKIWLIDHLVEYASKSNTIVIHGGWNGVLASLLFQTNLKIDKIISVDIDIECEETANTINKLEEIAGKFQAITCNMLDFQYTFIPDIVINTSCEHITQENYNIWLKNIPQESLIILQSNNYFNIDEHIRCSRDLEEFKDQSNINIIKSSTLQFPLYNRFMIIGYKR
jgi:hypothetical protein